MGNNFLGYFNPWSARINFDGSYPKVATPAWSEKEAAEENKRKLEADREQEDVQLVVENPGTENMK